MFKAAVPVALMLAFVALLVTSTAAAELHVSAAPVLGPTTPASGGWLECVVRIDNDGTRPERGTVEITSSAGYPIDDKLDVRAPFAVASGAAVNVRLPIRTFPHGGPIVLRVNRDDGSQVVETSIATSGSISPFLLDATEPPRLAGALRDIPVTVAFDPTGGSLPRSHVSGKVPTTTGTVRVDGTTGDPVLPERAAGYASATLVVMRSDQLARLSGMQLGALANFVLAGGSVALTVTRPEDLRASTLVAWVGGEIAPAPAPRLLRRTPGEAVERSHGHGTPSRPAPRGARVYPGEDVDNGLSGYRGGNLRPTLFGAAASYGLGEVHILAFDPTQAPGVDDAWVQSRMVDLLSHAWDRRQFLAAPHAAAFPDDYRMKSVFKVLDPNQSSRWAIIVAALILTIYSVLAGPVNFARAARRNRPLRALWFLPILSLGVFLSLVVLGVASKGWTGKARHLTLIEAAPGLTKATACRYRAFFTSNSTQLTVRATDMSSVLDTATTPRAGASRSLVADRDGMQLVDLSTMPWETLIVREDGFASLGAGVSVLRDVNGELTITNRMSRDLRAVLVVVPSPVPGGPRKVYFLPRIGDGESTRASEGMEVPFKPWRSGSTRISESDLAPIRKQLDGESSGLVAAWAALGTVSERNVEWWPDDVPIVMAQVDGGEGASHDAGLRLDEDRVLLRVVGYGGVE